MSDKRYYVSWSTNGYETSEDIFDGEDALLRWLNERAGYPNFTFRVVCGYEVKLEPVEVVREYRIEGR